MTQTRVYCKTVGFNDALIEKIVQKYDSNNSSVRITDDITPQLWITEGQESRNSVDAPLHHLFHGVVATEVEIIGDFFKSLNLGTWFEELSNKYTNELASLNLSWLKLKTLPKKSWLGENSLGFVELCPLFTAFSSLTRQFHQQHLFPTRRFLPYNR